MKSARDISDTIYQAITESPVNSTHSHHLPDHEMPRLTLFRVFQQSYVNWCMTGFTADAQEARSRIFDVYRCNSYVTWLIRALETLYPAVGQPLSVDTWDNYDRLIRKAHQNPEHHLNILRERCGYETIILDQYNDPGSDNGHSDLFKPTYRLDAFFSGYAKNGRDHNGVSPYDMIDAPSDVTLPEYLSAIRQSIHRAQQRQDTVALKVAIAYERDLYFQNFDLSKAAHGFRRKEASSQDIHNFQDYLMDSIMAYAAEFNLPVQIHTGLGQLKGTRAMALSDLIERHPDTQFDLFHASFPWTDDVLALAHNYQNVYIDLCWLPLLSPTRAITFIKEALEVTDANRLLWGCDTWTSEESYGALLAARYCISAALGSLVEDGRFSQLDAVQYARQILHGNTERLFNME